MHLGLRGEVEKTENNMKKYNNEMDTVFSLFIFYSLVTSLSENNILITQLFAKKNNSITNFKENLTSPRYVFLQV